MPRFDDNDPHRWNGAPREIDGTDREPHPLGNVGRHPLANANRIEAVATQPSLTDELEGIAKALHCAAAELAEIEHWLYGPQPTKPEPDEPKHAGIAYLAADVRRFATSLQLRLQALRETR